MQKTVSLWVASSAIIGAGISFHSVYLFHILAGFWFFLGALKFAFKKKIVVNNYRIVFPIFFIAGFTFVSVLWHPDFLTWARYQFYLICSLTVIFSVFLYAESLEDLTKIFRVLGIFVILSVLVGLLESFELIRWPTSNYSIHKKFFGYSGEADFVFNEYFANKPSGFSFNYNSYGFVILIFSPFFILYPNIYFRMLSFAVIIWFISVLGSKAIFLSCFILAFFIPFYSKLSITLLFQLYCIIPLLFLLVLAPVYLTNVSSEVLRMYSVLDQVEILFSLIQSVDIQALDSTAIRAQIYSTGINELIASHGLGLGYGGIEYVVGGSFHFFYLQLLIDFGIIPFIIVMLLFFKVIFKLRRVSLQSNDLALAYYARCSSLGLLVSIPASVAPSGIHYNLPFFALIGFAFAVLKIVKKEGICGY